MTATQQTDTLTEALNELARIKQLMGLIVTMKFCNHSFTPGVFDLRSDESKTSLPRPNQLDRPHGPGQMILVMDQPWDRFTHQKRISFLQTLATRLPSFYSKLEAENSYLVLTLSKRQSHLPRKL